MKRKISLILSLILVAVLILPSISLAKESSIEPLGYDDYSWYVTVQRRYSNTSSILERIFHSEKRSDGYYYEGYLNLDRNSINYSPGTGLYTATYEGRIYKTSRTHP